MGVSLIAMGQQSVIVVHPRQANSRSAASACTRSCHTNQMGFTHTRASKSTKECTFWSHDPLIDSGWIQNIEFLPSFFPLNKWLLHSLPHYYNGDTWAHQCTYAVANAYDKRGWEPHHITCIDHSSPTFQLLRNIL